ncbi:ABC transporter permease [Paraburkholderia rhizosphaerae]|uniref:Autoinducer 2 import system permease protein LsrD n=1 Tax=Paraburkholderia rhizosphaerae TaxID=480658 RepID=A0A4R8LJ82_9BURK|nr:ABC transporter permease [Paraburkholderia rhizosphaerae]TDY43820.1 monosaccharide ABC transporter membrane protein (CUT2 family) [Paraburkholderia rhizosphaerae]
MNPVAPRRDTAPARALPLALVQRYGIYLFLVLLIALSGAWSPTFLRIDNVLNMLVQFAPLGIVVIGQTFVILVGGLDLSVASVMATAAVIATAFDSTNHSAPAIFGITFVLSVGAGLLNGLLVTKRQVSPFLATFATAVVLDGLRFAYTQGAPSGNVPPLFHVMGTGSIAGIPVNVLMLAVCAALFGTLLHLSTFGRRVYMVGGNPIAAKLVGVSPDTVRIACYVISALLAGLAGLTLSGYVGIVDNWVGRGFELDSIVAAVMGGLALSGGRGSLPGALAGAAILVIVFNIVLLLGMPVQAQIIVKGAIIIAASACYVSRQRR